MQVGLADILTAAKNIVSSLSSIHDVYSTMMGNQKSAEVNAATLVFSGQGRLVRVSVTDTGTTDGTLYDCKSASTLQNPIALVAAAGSVIEYGIPISNGLVFVPGTSQKGVVVYSKQQ